MTARERFRIPMHLPTPHPQSAACDLAEAVISAFSPNGEFNSRTSEYSIPEIRELAHKLLCETHYTHTIAHALIVEAAPDLLAALKAITATIAGHSSISSLPVFTMAENAIRKAEGRL